MKWKKDKSNRGDDPATANDKMAKLEEGNVAIDDNPPAASIAGSNSNTLRYKPARRSLHNVFIIISVLTSICALWMIGVQVMGFVVYENGPVDYVLRSYIIVFSILVIFVELEWPKFAREASLLHYWIPRGLIYVFIGVLGLQENDSVVKEGYTTYATMLEVAKVGAWNMIGCGILYFCMGVLCLQLVLKRLRKSYQEKLAQYKGLDSSSENKKQPEDSNKDMEGVEGAFEGVEVSLGDEEKEDGDDLNTEEDDPTGRKSDVEKAQDESSTQDESSAQDESTTESRDKEKGDEKDWWNDKDKEEIDTTERKSGAEEAQEESTTGSVVKSASSTSEKEDSDTKSSAA